MHAAPRTTAAVAVVLAVWRPVHGLVNLYQRSESYMGQDFFGHFTFYTGADPTHGTVKFLDEAAAWNDKLLSISDSRVLIRSDNTTVVPDGEGRKALRIESKTRYNGGLFVVEMDHVPTACGAWPAFWMFGDDAQHVWPRWGEFDIWEAIHTQNAATTTLHTRENCDQRAVNEGIDFQGQGWSVGTQSNKAKNCWVHANAEYDNQGCGQKLQDGSAGPKFNVQGGGTFIAEWDPVVNKRLRTWFFPKGQEPEMGNNPNPDTFGMPNSFFTLNEKWCTSGHFHNMRMVFDVTFCGDYAGGTFHSSCPEIQMSCAEYVRSKPSAFSEAFWSIRRLDVYQSRAVQALTGEQPGTAWTAILASLAAVALLGVVLYYYCSRQRIAAVGQALTAPMKSDGKLQLPITKATRSGAGGLVTSPVSRREVFLQSEAGGNVAEPEVEPAPPGLSWRRLWLMFCCANEDKRTPNKAQGGTRPIGYDEVHPTSPTRTPSRTGEVTPMQPTLRKEGSAGRVGSGILVRAPSGALVDQARAVVLNWSAGFGQGGCASPIKMRLSAREASFRYLEALEFSIDHPDAIQVLLADGPGFGFADAFKNSAGMSSLQVELTAHVSL
eukprot:s3579_g5.t1